MSISFSLLFFLVLIGVVLSASQLLTKSVARRLRASRFGDPSEFPLGGSAVYGHGALLDLLPLADRPSRLDKACHIRSDVGPAHSTSRRDRLCARLLLDGAGAEEHGQV